MNEWMTVDDMERQGQIPCDIFDGNWSRIDLPITGFCSQTGEVEAYAQNEDGSKLFIGSAFKRQRLFFPAPLTYRKIKTWNAEKTHGETYDP